MSDRESIGGRESLPELPVGENLEGFKTLAEISGSNSAAKGVVKFFEGVGKQYNAIKDADGIAGKCLKVAETLGTIATSKLVNDTGVLIAAALTTGP